MPGYARDGSSWSTGPVRARTASGWTGEGDAGYVWDGTEWVKFQPDPSSLLPAPENLGVVATDTSAVATWTNPEAATTAGATDVQYRVPENGGGAWTELTYPATSLTLGFLRPETNYQLQVRYIIRSETDGSISDTGPIAEVFFTTDSLDGPGTLAPDPGGSGPDTIVPWGPTGNPGPVGGPGCWWEYVVQIVDSPVEGAISWSDTAMTGEFDGEASLGRSFDFVAAGLECNGLGRWKYREVCDGTPGDWFYSDPYVIPCDWDTACGGNTNASLSTPPYSDANLISFVPHVCPIDGGASEPSDPTRIVDDVTDQVFSKDSYFFGVSRYLDNDIVVANSSAPDYGGPVISGYNSNLQNITASSDVSFSGFFMLDSQPPTALLGGTKLVTIGRTFRVQAYGSGSGFTVGAIFPKAGGGAFNLQDTTELALDVWHTWTVTIDADGDKILYINGEAAVTDSTATNPDFDGTGLTSEIALFGNAWARQGLVATWDRVLAPNEIVSSLHTSPWVSTQVHAPGTNTITYPSGITGTNQIAYIVAVSSFATTGSGGSTITTPSGFTKIGDNRNAAAFYKILDGTETGSVTATNAVSLGMWIVDNVDTDYPVGVHGAEFSTSTFLTDTQQSNVETTDIPLANSSAMALHIWDGISSDGFALVSGVADQIVPADYGKSYIEKSALSGGEMAVAVWAENMETVTRANDPHPRSSSYAVRAENSLDSGYTGFLNFTLFAPRDTSYPKVVSVYRDQRTNSTPVYTVDPNTDDGDIIVIFANLSGGTTAVPANTTEQARADGTLDRFIATAVYASAHGASYSPTGTFTSTSSRYATIVRVIDGTAIVTAQQTIPTYGSGWPTFPNTTSELSLTATGANQLALFSGHVRSSTAGVEFASANGWELCAWTLGYTAGGSDGSSMVSTLVTTASGDVGNPTHDFIDATTPMFPFTASGIIIS